MIFVVCAGTLILSAGAFTIYNISKSNTDAKHSAYNSNNSHGKFNSSAGETSNSASGTNTEKNKGTASSTQGSKSNGIQSGSSKANQSTSELAQPWSGSISNNSVGSSSGPGPGSGFSSGTSSTGCFASPGSCGYPDPAYHNVGVSDCSTLTPFNPGSLPAGTYWSGSGNTLEISAADVTLSGYNFGNWTIYVSAGANNFTLNNSCISYNGGGTDNSTGISDAAGVSGTVIENSNIGGSDNGSGAIGDVLTLSNTLIKNNYIYNAGDDINGDGDTIQNNYLLVNTTPTGSHNENLYFNSGNAILTGNTILNSQEQTAIVFGDSGSACSNDLTFTNNLAAGGGYLFYPCGNATSVGTSTMNIQNNRFARCLGAAVNGGNGGNVCSGLTPGASDGHGYYPNGGFFGVAAYIFCPPTSGQTWSNNVWDDSNSPVSC